MRSTHFLNKQSRFSIRKLSIGICSVAIGHILLTLPQSPTIAYATEDITVTNDTMNDNVTTSPDSIEMPEINPNTDGETITSETMIETLHQDESEVVVPTVETPVTNLSLNRPTSTSGSENDINVHANAFDGNPNTRYAGAKMKNNNQPDAPQTPQWLQIDLGTKASVESIDVDFYLKVYATDYVIESSADGESNWQTVATRNTLQPSPTLVNPTDHIQFETPVEVERFMRFTFNRVNHHAYGNSVSVKDIAINGRLLHEVEVPIDPIAKLQAAELAIENERVVLTNIEEDDKYTYEIIGSTNSYVVSNNGTLSSYRLNDQDITLLVAARHKENQQLVNESKMNKTIHVAAKHQETVSGTNVKPQLALDIHEFLAGEGMTTLTANDTIYISEQYKAQADLFKEDLRNILGLDLAYSTEADAKIIFHLTDEYDLKDEGYLIRIGDKVEIYAHNPKAFNYAAVTLAQMLQKDQQLTNGVYRDYPNYAIRGMVLDVARIPMRMDFLEQVSKVFRWYKLNELHLHFNDTQWPDGSRADVNAWKLTESAHRLESEKFPSLNKRPFKHDRYEGEYDFYRDIYKNPQYSLDEFKAFQQHTALAGINILAEFDTPGHSAAYSLYAIDNPDNIDYLGKPIHHPQDLEALAINETAYPEETARAKRFVHDLVKDYLDKDIFTYAHIHLGVDEYWQKQGNIESFRQYLNELSALAKAKGKTLRTWGALSQFKGTTPVDTDIIFDEWAQYESISEERINEGFRVVNVPQPFMYVTPGRYHKDSLNEQYVFDHWNPTVFNLNYQNKRQAVLPGEPLLLGAKGALWGDEHREGIEESDLYHRLEKSLAMIGYKTWNPYSTRNFLDYQKILEETKLTNNYLALPTNSEVLVHLDAAYATPEHVTDLSTNEHTLTNEGNVEVVELDGAKWFKFNGENYLTSDIETIGLPYTLEMTIRPTDVNNGTLLLSQDGAIYLNSKGRQQQDGSVAEGLTLNRYFYSQHIAPVLEANKEYKLTFSATRQVLVVYLNDQKVATFAHQNETAGNSQTDRNFRTSFNLPFAMIGRGFKGYMRDIKVYNRTSSDEEAVTEQLDKLNIALHKPVYSYRNNSLFYDQGIRPYNRFKVTDGDIAAGDGRWNSSDRDNDYFIIDFNKVTDFSEVELHFDPTRMADSFKLSISNDMEHFTDIHQTTDNQNALVQLNVANQQARYLKFTVLKRKAGTNETAVKEVRVYQPLASREALKERLATKAEDVSNSQWLAVHNTAYNKFASSEAITAALADVEALPAIELPKDSDTETPNNPGENTPDKPETGTPGDSDSETPKDPETGDSNNDTHFSEHPRTFPTTDNLPIFDGNRDDDQDGYSNQAELLAHTDPYNASSKPQTQQKDSTPQHEHPPVAPIAADKPIFHPNDDDDRDGYTNQQELVARSNPYDAQSFPRKNTPSNGMVAHNNEMMQKETPNITNSTNASLPETGEATPYALFSVSVLAILASVGIHFSPTSRED